MSREAHVQFCEGLAGKYRRSTLLKALAFSNDGLRLASVAMDSIIRIWDLRSGVVEKVLNKERKDTPIYLSFSPDGQVLAAGTGHGQVVLWRLTDGTVIRRIDAHKGSVPSVQFSKDGKTLISAGLDKKISSWDVLLRSS